MPYLFSLPYSLAISDFILFQMLLCSFFSAQSSFPQDDLMAIPFTETHAQVSSLHRAFLTQSSHSELVSLYLLTLPTSTPRPFSMAVLLYLFYMPLAYFGSIGIWVQWNLSSEGQDLYFVINLIFLEHNRMLNVVVPFLTNAYLREQCFF